MDLKLDVKRRYEEQISLELQHHFDHWLNV